MRKLITLLFACFSLTAYSQYSVQGRVVDKQTGASLAFVNMVVTGHPQIGATADIDGNFKITSSIPITSLSFTYVGYKDLVVPIHSDSAHVKHLLVKLEESSFNLKEVVLPLSN
jgi:hypothetical protein